MNDGVSIIRRIVSVFACGLCAALAGSNLAFAQVPGGLPSTVEPGRDRPALALPAQPNFDFRIETPNRSPVPRAVDEVRFHLNDIQVTGVVTFPPEHFKPLYQALIGKEVGLSDILDVADAIEAEYRRAGYLLVRAFVPPQRVADGVFAINVVEGFVANVSVQGGDAGTRERIQTFLKPVLESKPLRLAVIEQGLLLANDMPGVVAGGVLRPSPDTRGASDLVVTVTQRPVTGGLAIDNRGSKFSGVWTGLGRLELNSLLDDGDQLAGSLTTATNITAFEGQISGRLGYYHPVGEQGAVLNLTGTVTRGEPGSTLRQINVLTHSWAVGPRMTYPIIRTRAESAVLQGGLTAQMAGVSAFGKKYSHDDWRVLDLGMTYQRNDFIGGALALDVDVAKGLDIWGATENGSPELSRVGAKTDFTKVTGGIHFSRPIVAPFSLKLAAQGQYAFDRLVAGEQFVAGGAQIGRGYDPGALSGDRGLAGSIEFCYDQVSNISFVLGLQPYVFFDAARVWDVQNVSTSQHLRSLGGGVRFWLIDNFFGALEVTRTLDTVPDSDGGKRATKLLLNLATSF